jgi:ADP-heptose:LPS heptosyltransferase
MAALANTYSLGIYGPTDFYYTGPFSNRSRVVSRFLGCSPCYQNTATGCGIPACLIYLDPEFVCKAVMQAVEAIKSKVGTNIHRWEKSAITIHRER